MRIAIAQMAAEELGVDTARITVVDGDTARCPNTGGTGGSTGLTRGGTAVRQAAATARQALLGLAATRLKRPVADLTIVDGEVRPVAGGRGVGIGVLVGGRRLWRCRSTPKAPLVSPSQYTRVGQSPARPDVPAKCTGRYQYIQDFTVPGMLHCRVIRPPAIGATLVSVDEASIAKFPGVRVVRIESFLAVVAEDEWAAVQGLARAEGDVDRVARPAWSRQPGALSPRRRRRPRPGDCEPRAVRSDRRRRSVRRGARGGAGVSDDEDGGDLLLAVSEPCVAGALVRRRGRSRRRRHDLDLVTGHLRSARHAVASLRPRAREDARRLHGRVGIVRHERRRPCRGGRAARLEDHREAGARAVVAPGRARLGSEGTAAVARPACGSRCVRPHRGVGHADVDSHQPTGRQDSAGGAIGGHSPGQRTRRRRGLRERRSGLSGRPRQGARALDARHAAQSVQSARTREARECVRGRELRRRDRGVAPSRRARVPRRPTERSPRARGAQPRVEGVRLAIEAIPQPGRPDQRRPCRARRGLHAIQADGELHRDVHGGCRGSRRAAGSPCGASSAPTTAVWS